MFAGEPWEPGREDLGVSVNVNGNDLVRTTAQPTSESGRTLKVNAANSQRVRLERIARARILWDNRRTLAWSTLCGFVFSIVVVLLLPKGFEATTKLMPPESGSGNGTALMAALATRGTGSMLGGWRGNCWGPREADPCS